jgi:hypothetical protein
VHGSATVALAKVEVQPIMFIDPEKQVRGIEISANHLRSKRRNCFMQLK